MDVPHALKLIDEYKLDAVLVLGRDCYKAVDLIADRDLPVILDPDLVFWETDPRTDEDEQIVLPRIYREAGVPITFQAEGISRTSPPASAVASSGTRRPPPSSTACPPTRRWRP